MHGSRHVVLSHAPAEFYTNRARGLSIIVLFGDVLQWRRHPELQRRRHGASTHVRRETIALGNYTDPSNG